MEHTKEPWEVRDVDGLVAIAHLGGFVLESDDDRQNVVDARRIVACVNACAGIKTEQLENTGIETVSNQILVMLREERDVYKSILEDHGPEGHNCTNQQFVDIRIKLEKAKSQRDELLAALKDIVDGNDLAMERNQDMSSWRESDFRRHAVTIIEKIEGK